MALDTRYRPRTYDDVLGQDASVAVLKQYVKEGRGYHQSYVFCGQHGSGKCITGPSLVVTDRGFVQIENLMGGPDEIAPIDVRVSQEVSFTKGTSLSPLDELFANEISSPSKKGTGVSRAAFSYRGGFRDTIRVRTHLGFEIEGTPNHRIRVMGSSGVIEWRRLDEIRPDDYACIARQGLFGQGADLNGFYDKRWTPPGGYEIAPFEAPSEITPEWGRLMGYMVGDDRCKSEYIEISNADEDVKSDILDLLARLYGSGRGTPDKRSKVGLENLRCCHVRPRDFLEFAGMAKCWAGEKEIPWSILASPRPVVKEFLRGYFEADGSVGPGGIEAVTASIKLARQIQIVLLQFGIVSRVSPKLVEGYGTYHRILFGGDNARIFGREIGFVSRRKSTLMADFIDVKHAKTGRISNCREVVPHQERWAEAAYRRLPRNERTADADRVFQSRNGTIRMTVRNIDRIVSEFSRVDVDGHFEAIHTANYYYDPIAKIEASAAEVFDLNVPDGEMFAANGFMNHNTTMGRILARALLCEAHVDGAPCDRCASCRAILEGGVHECFTELDAATKSGKDDMLRITEEIRYSSFSGRQRIYLFDESHRLSTQALDALLKPMEDNAPGSENKLLVCIFCTTEPEKMKATIFSRCAPAFVIRPVPPEIIGQRLLRICETEGIRADLDALTIIAETVDSHIRDALKVLEGASLAGPVTVESVMSYLKLGSNDLVIDILDGVGIDLDRAIAAVSTLADAVSPAVAYERIAEAAILAYKRSLNLGKIPGFWRRERVEALAGRGPVLASIASRFAAPPRRPSPHTLVLDVAAVHHTLVAGLSLSSVGTAPLVVTIAPSNPPPPRDESSRPRLVESITVGSIPQDESKVVKQEPQRVVVGDVVVNQKAVGAGSGARNRTGSSAPAVSSSMDPSVFRTLVRRYLWELSDGRLGSPR